MSLRRSGTRKALAAPTPTVAKPKKGYEIVQQGMKELYPQDKSFTPEVE